MQGVQFGFQGMGYIRAQRYRAFPTVANAVFSVYTVTEETAAQVGEPLADVAVQYLPDEWLERAAEVASPVQGVVCLVMIALQLLKNEKQVVEGLMDRHIGTPETPPGPQPEAVVDPGEAFQQAATLNPNGDAPY